MELQTCACHQGVREAPGPLHCKHLAIHLQSAEEGKEKEPPCPLTCRPSSDLHRPHKSRRGHGTSGLLSRPSPLPPTPSKPKLER